MKYINKIKFHFRHFSVMYKMTPTPLLFIMFELTPQNKMLYPKLESQVCNFVPNINNKRGGYQ